MSPVFGRLLMVSLGLVLYAAVAAVAAPSPNDADEPAITSTDEVRSITATDESGGDEGDSGSEDSGSGSDDSD